MSTLYDPLGKYRKEPHASAGGGMPPEQTEGYAAFGAKDKVARLRIRSRKAPVNAPGYNILLNLVYDEIGTNFILVYSILTVLVRGRNLQRLIFAIENEQADFIQEFDAGRWPRPKDSGEPFIDSIELRVVEQNAPSVATKQ